MREQELIISLSKELTIDDLPNETARMLARVIGVELTIKVILEFDGVQFYFPKSLRTHLKHLYVQKHFDGSNVRDLALKLDLAERTVYEWIDQKKIKTHEQQDLFGLKSAAA